MAQDKMVVVFTKTNMPYRKGDVAGFTESAAKSFIDAKIAEKYDAPKRGAKD